MQTDDGDFVGKNHRRWRFMLTVTATAGKIIPMQKHSIGKRYG